MCIPHGLLFSLLFVSQIHAEGTFNVTSFNVHMDDRPPSICEWPNYLEVQTGYTSACAEVECRIPEADEWTISFIQQINSVVWRQDYSSSYYQWELGHYPYCDPPDYLGKIGGFWATGGAIARGGDGEHPIKIQVSFLDSPKANFMWDDIPPLSSEQRRMNRDLREVTKKYSFTTWLAAERKSDHKLILLKRYDWTYGYHITINCTLPLGLRVQKNDADNVLPVVTDPREQDLANLIKDGILSGKQWANHDIHLWYYSKADPNVRVRFEDDPKQ